MCHVLDVMKTVDGNGLIDNMAHAFRFLSDKFNSLLNICWLPISYDTFFPLVIDITQIQVKLILSC